MEADTQLPPRSPNLSAYAVHYHLEPNHQGLDNRLIAPPSGAPNTKGAVECRERLGGVLKYYYRRAA